MKYVEDLHKAHEEWLKDPNQQIPVFVVDANKKLTEIIEVCQKQLPVLFNKELTSKFL